MASIQDPTGDAQDWATEDRDGELDANHDAATVAVLQRAW